MTVQAQQPTREHWAILAILVQAYPSFLTTWEVGNRITQPATRSDIAHALTVGEEMGDFCSYRSAPGETVGWSLATPILPFGSPNEHH